ncbi:methionine/alanine import family NSS transporter small subunit [Enteractinococcus helveticum]|uniref:methionine/alanine import family NSS transporter small subunit n=1 Tax=Enteractinococcus helveticum TaxID=1837282 RepID=UPI0009ED04FF|nr:methionine/alanine import family NSS transporter small subunit [Enteractinococcus helveticum]
MSPIAIVMMVIACVTVFGGVVFAMINLQRHPDEVSGEFAEAEEEILGGKTL